MSAMTDSRWRPIAARPSGDVMILATNGTEVVAVSAADIYREHNGDGEEPGPPMIRSRGDLGEITHWQHYPEPPK